MVQSFNIFCTPLLRQIEAVNRKGLKKYNSKGNGFFLELLLLVFFRISLFLFYETVAVPVL